MSWRASQQRAPQNGRPPSETMRSSGEHQWRRATRRVESNENGDRRQQTRTYMKTYSAIKAEIAKLEKQAQALRKSEVAGVIAKIKEAIAAYALTAADLGLGRSAVKAAPVPKAKNSKKTSTTIGVAKYRDPKTG